ncbi:response regulator [Desulfatiglans anilini]|uniref:response regulator n=1 Tax=Desulfatiglans anilini TaxID=90728 RepID=UPI00040B9A4E|nr:response regulator [Desulfatiglans anilini]
MGEHQSVKVLIVEKNAEITQTLKSILEKRGFDVSMEPRAEEGLQLLKKGGVALALAGSTEEGIPTLELMCKIVMQSPMTSLILISEFSSEELDEKAEGYGILGNIHPQTPADGLDELIDTFDNIHQALRTRK